MALGLQNSGVAFGGAAKLDHIGFFHPDRDQSTDDQRERHDAPQHDGKTAGVGGKNAEDSNQDFSRQDLKQTDIRGCLGKRCDGAQNDGESERIQNRQIKKIAFEGRPNRNRLQ